MCMYVLKKFFTLRNLRNLRIAPPIRAEQLQRRRPCVSGSHQYNNQTMTGTSKYTKRILPVLVIFCVPCASVTRQTNIRAQIRFQIQIRRRPQIALNKSTLHAMSNMNATKTHFTIITIHKLKTK